jgi:hypothetical protein
LSIPTCVNQPNETPASSYPHGKVPALKKLFDRGVKFYAECD